MLQALLALLLERMQICLRQKQNKKSQILHGQTRKLNCFSKQLKSSHRKAFTTVLIRKARNQSMKRSAKCLSKYIQKIKDGDVLDDEYPRLSKLEEITKERISAKLKIIRKNYKNAVDCGKRGGCGRVVMTFYNLCHDIWAGAPSTKRIEGTVHIIAHFVFRLGILG